MSKLKERVHGVLAIDPEAHAIEYKGVWHSWGEIARAMDGIERALDAVQLVAGTAVGVLLRNHPPHIAALLSVVTTDRCLVTLNPMLPEEKLIADIRGLKVPALIAESEDWRRPGLVEVAREIGALAIELTGDKASPVGVIEGLEAPRGRGHHKQMPGIAIEMLTSGTTGAPKRVPLKSLNFERALVDAMVYEGDRNPDDPPKLRPGTQILHTPFVHIGGMWGAFSVVMAGRRLCLLEKFTVADWHDAVVRHRPRVAGGPPTALRMILDANIPREDLSSLRALRAGTAPLDPAVADEFMRRYGIPVLQNYGATEFAGGVAGWTLKDFHRHWQERRDSVGRVHDGIDARVVDAETGGELPFGQEGLLEIHAPQIGDGVSWVRTTDRAVMDIERFLWIRGRADNAIIRGGFKVHPDDVVKALESHPAVREASIVGMPDRRLGQVPVAALVLKSGAKTPNQEDLEAFARTRLTPYQVPVMFKIVDELPRTPSMKVSMPAVRELFAEGMSNDAG